MKRSIVGSFVGRLFREDGTEILRGNITKTSDCPPCGLPDWTRPGQALELTLARLLGTREVPNDWDAGLPVKITVTIDVPEAQPDDAKEWDDASVDTAGMTPAGE